MFLVPCGRIDMCKGRARRGFFLLSSRLSDPTRKLERVRLGARLWRLGLLGLDSRGSGNLKMITKRQKIGNSGFGETEIALTAIEIDLACTRSNVPLL